MISWHETRGLTARPLEYGGSSWLDALAGRSDLMVTDAAWSLCGECVGHTGAFNKLSERRQASTLLCGESQRAGNEPNLAPACKHATRAQEKSPSRPVADFKLFSFTCRRPKRSCLEGNVFLGECSFWWHAILFVDCDVTPQRLPFF